MPCSRSTQPYVVKTSLSRLRSSSMSRGGVGCRRGPGGMGSVLASASGGGARSIASSCFLNVEAIHHITAAARIVTPMTARLKPTMERRLTSSSSYDLSSWWMGLPLSSMTEGLLEPRLVHGQERARFELAREGENPEAAEREGQCKIERVERDMVGKCGRREPLEIEPSHEKHHD